MRGKANQQAAKAFNIGPCKELPQGGLAELFSNNSRTKLAIG